MGTPADDAVIAAAKSGDETAWRELYDTLGGRLIGCLRSQQTRDSATDAEDLASEAWMTAARRISEFHGTTDDFAGWIFVIARNVLVNTGRRSTRRATTPTSLDPRELVDDLPTNDETALVADRDWIRRLLDVLSPREREVVACIDIAGLDVATTSSVLGIGRSAVKVAHHRALKRLHKILTEPDPDDAEPDDTERTPTSGG
jgi:RNA polymerase sigma-70 factor (ECF subfamily)